MWTSYQFYCLLLDNILLASNLVQHLLLVIIMCHFLSVQPTYLLFSSDISIFITRLTIYKRCNNILSSFLVAVFSNSSFHLKLQLEFVECNE